MQRIICARARVSSTRLRTGTVGKDEQKRLGIEGMKLAGEPLFIHALEAPTISELRAKVRREVRKNGIKCIMVDYAQLVRAPGATAKNREAAVGEVSRGLKAMAMELDIPVIAAAQLNRQAEMRGDNRPKLADLRESGSLEQDPDIVTLIFRGSYYESGDMTGEPQDAEWTLAKHREGKTGMLPLVWHPEFTRFDSARIASMTDEPVQEYSTQPNLHEINTLLNE
jgi:replicative DNA helicase